ncbi:hypothetical protein ACFXAF_38630 [Kitasatospora sp. NPDC059463]
MPESINPEPTEAEDEEVDVVAHGIEEEDGLVEDICIINNSAAL